MKAQCARLGVQLSPPKTKAPMCVLSLSENTQRYKSLVGFAICFEHLATDEMFKTRYLLRKRYALRGVKGFILYRIRTANISPNRKRADIQGFLLACLLFSAHNKGLGLAQMHLTGQIRCSPLSRFHAATGCEFYPLFFGMMFHLAVRSAPCVDTASIT